MKKLLVLFTAAVSVFAFSELYANQSNVGCGLGSMIFRGQSGLLSQTLAITTNHILFNQSFGITSGTLNCSRFSGIVSNERVTRYVADNLDSLAIDIARGSGEYLSTFAVLMEVNDSERAAFYSKLQNNFSRIFPSQNVTHLEVLQNIETVLRSS